MLDFEGMILLFQEPARVRTPHAKCAGNVLQRKLASTNRSSPGICYHQNRVIPTEKLDHMDNKPKVQHGVCGDFS